MKEKTATAIALKHSDLKMIDSAAQGMQYIICENGDGIVVSGLYGMTGFTREQALALVNELPMILEVFKK